MAKEMISVDMIDEQLFTELTAEEGSIIEGGATFTLHSVYSQTAGADLLGKDELYVKFDGEKIFSRKMGTGDFARTEKTRWFNGDSALQLFDDDPWPNPDDKIGTAWISETPVSKAWAYIAGSGSKYWVQYSVA